MRSTGRQRASVFLFLAVLLVGIAYFLVFTKRAGPFPVLVLMWAPGLAGLLTLIVTGRSLRGMGWLPGQPRYLAYAFVIPWVVALPVYGFAWATGLANLNVLGVFQEQAGDAPAWQAVISFLTLGVLWSLVSATGEELGWRGVFVPALADWFGRDVSGFHRLALLSGAVWAVYHYPLLIFGSYNSGLPVFVTLPAFTLLVLAASYVFAWITLKSGSVWPAALLHATHNQFIQGFFDAATVNGEYSLYITSEFGYGLPISYAVLAWLCVRDVKQNGLPVR